MEIDTQTDQPKTFLLRTHARGRNQRRSNWVKHEIQHPGKKSGIVSGRWIQMRFHQHSREGIIMVPNWF